ncbi:hypothetical protein P168DRAFT_178978 [Aspergillus campestris IBT 28561]|uniref:Uncharacterized protein n=1 Tax=Aspergillus campestris (strain IBT 28561) TaxID=1392248 RepID=A0A2I1CZW2_ASPC2|nr:uncharacterized protein P168DRAFT_178978 [Aspergillus campestris IBT 28561]PKY03173.1 hypothetical protein P168DRAFT_178978 [Aspergillus campestris IBT 28561]
MSHYTMLDIYLVGQLPLDHGRTCCCDQPTSIPAADCPVAPGAFFAPSSFSNFCYTSSCRISVRIGREMEGDLCRTTVGAMWYVLLPWYTAGAFPALCLLLGGMVRYDGTAAYGVSTLVVILYGKIQG